MVDLFDLNGKTAIVTGGTRGIGKFIAIGLAEAGADIVLLQRNVNDTGTKEAIESTGKKAFIVESDMSNLKQIRRVVANIIHEYGEIHILVNSAGIQRRSPAVDFSEKDWDEVIDINLKSVWILCQEIGKHMVENREGKIINIASLTSFQGGVFIPAYASAKGAIAQLTKALSNEWAKYNVNVNAIAPGYIETDLNTALLNDSDRSKQILDRIPAERWGHPEDFKGSAIFLASDSSKYVHGHILLVDGGWMGR
ncbi:glucose 1-dehydrogenase [Oceanobacillus timonensis]|uniref:glucose 1-dehydrogenase n=1 Tax=Oceanobacillus timonensis TaxID=1926285 RepID=UPI0015C4716F